jgi:hypothetical protein
LAANLWRTIALREASKHSKRPNRFFYLAPRPADRILPTALVANRAPKTSWFEVPNIYFIFSSDNGSSANTPDAG